jgi:uncharacterized protein
MRDRRSILDRMPENGVYSLSGNTLFQNLLGGTMQVCSDAPLTGYFRNGYCATCPDDHGMHTVCAQLTQEFLDFTRSRGNDLSTPHPPHFPGLKEGDKWCLCASRWFEAFEAGKAPNIFASATNSAHLRQTQISALLSRAIDLAKE